MKRRQESTIYGMWLVVFVICFISGVCLTNLWSEEIVDKSGFLGDYMLLCMRQVKVDYTGYLLYLLQKRAGAALILAVFSTTYLGLVGIYLAIGWVGFSSGIFLAGAGIRYGTKGILLFLGGMIPHQLLLLPCSVMFLFWCYRMCTALYYPARCMEPIFGSRKQYILRKALQFQIILGVVIIGCLLECYVNPYIITKLLKFF